MVESKGFFQVFPDLKLEHNLTELLNLVEVNKISTNHTKDAIRVYMTGTRIIPKKSIYMVQNEIQKQMFGRTHIHVQIIENYILSKQYTPRSLWEEYRESILEELRSSSIVMYNMMRKGSMEFTDENIALLKLEDTQINKTKSRELYEYLTEVISKRCGLELQLSVEYIKPKAGKYRKQMEQQEKNEIAEILKRNKELRQQHRQEKNAENPQSEEGMQKNNMQGNTRQKDKTPFDGQAENSKQSRSDKQKGSGRQGSSILQEEKKASYQKRDYYKKSNNPDVLYGREFDGEFIPIKDITEESGNVMIRGQVIFCETREIRNERTIILFSVTDFTDTISTKIFVKNENLPEILEIIKEGIFIKLSGMVMLDTYTKEISIATIYGIMKGSDFRVKRVDTSVEKRVELHCHTKMSDMDGVSEAKDILAQAIKWGHKALAITDHGNVQGFTEALHGMDKILGDYKKKGEKVDFKVIYGVEAYLVDDIKTIVTDSKAQSLDDTYVVFDIETTGFSAAYDKIIEIGAVKVINGKIDSKFSEFINPLIPIPFRIEQLTGINDSMVA